jgi:hypothetical protein
MPSLVSREVFFIAQVCQGLALPQSICHKEAQAAQKDFSLCLLRLFVAETTSCFIVVSV